EAEAEEDEDDESSHDEEQITNVLINIAKVQEHTSYETTRCITPVALSDKDTTPVQEQLTVTAFGSKETAEKDLDLPAPAAEYSDLAPSVSDSADTTTFVIKAGDLVAENENEAKAVLKLSPTSSEDSKSSEQEL
ncbi:unnamed protein product, partial [Gongylonema pulchrum]|uniref:CABYR protein n=1 Tax=Gongylonema pulchrum TaxID=637853 RepID=A0A183DCV9_9BILA